MNTIRWLVESTVYIYWCTLILSSILTTEHSNYMLFDSWSNLSEWLTVKLWWRDKKKRARDSNRFNIITNYETDTMYYLLTYTWAVFFPLFCRAVFFVCFVCVSRQNLEKSLDIYDLFIMWKHAHYLLSSLIGHYPSYVYNVYNQAVSSEHL